MVVSNLPSVGLNKCMNGFLVCIQHTSCHGLFPASYKNMNLYTLSGFILYP